MIPSSLLQSFQLCLNTEVCSGKLSWGILGWAETIWIMRDMRKTNFFLPWQEATEFGIFGPGVDPTKGAMKFKSEFSPEKLPKPKKEAGSSSNQHFSRASFTLLGCLASTGMKLLRFRLLFDHQDHRIIYH